MSDAHATIAALSKDFDPAIIRTKPGSKPGAKYFKPATKYVSHGSVTKRLNDVAPGWSSRVVEVHSFVNGAGLLTCAAVTLELTIPGVGSRQEVGTANQPRTFGDDLKNAMSDALKRAAMRFGVAIDLWEGMDEADEDAHPDDTAPMPATPAQRPQDARHAPARPTAPRLIAEPPSVLTNEQHKAIADARDMPDSGVGWAAVRAYLRPYFEAATKPQKLAIKREMDAIQAKYYPGSLTEQEVPA